ncbi:MAG: 50S ribosomal protein L6 [Candidatus Omnitrophica bacterium]|nr:50S ribosomal protein L6 [Candidatus Omnitrophota bacterium]MBU4303917.1 50S ribosomal protein L6 [Candidatus Omnitrophota bacterium]MBU4418714.1 50S ribosomal protein L6 [Candidatus Omnitrophota bacterium]MBU4468094.1 50S ribosomal protein L6 [Candidatus Omnitrophota bacterium]MCG2707869.1 50S ribosomal protein L6 [Candidatus Omnitrophota bacterium]
MSRLGNKTVAIPKDVKIEVMDGAVCVEGPKGKLARKLSGGISVEINAGILLVKRATDTKIDKSLHGLFRALIVNMIVGVTQGYLKELEIQGVGFKAAVAGDKLNMALGFSHPVNYVIPAGIKIETPKPTQIVIKGIDKELIGKVASEIRAFYPPEPYKGKGIRYVGEHVKKKVGKAQATGK